MRNVRRAVWSGLVLVAALALPASVLASSFDYGVIHDYCGGQYNWTTYYKIREIADGSTNANRLTIDSWIQARDPGHPHWYRAESWPQVSTTFFPDGTYHHLTLARHATGGVDTAVRIVYKLRAWHNNNLLWSLKVHSTTC